MENSKYGMWFVYAALALTMYFSEGGLATAAGWVIAIILLAHLAEFFMKRELLAKSDGSMGYHFVQTMIYGLFHWKPIEAQEESD